MQAHAPEVLARRRFARLDIAFSRLSLGTSAWSSIGGRDGDLAALEVVDAALDAGINYFDAAPYYGHGLSEARLGAALRWAERDGLVISSKVGIRLAAPGRPDALKSHYEHRLPLEPWCDYSREGIFRSLESSLDRMGLSRLDIAYMHGLSIAPGSREAVMASGMPALLEARRAGLVKGVGAGVNDVASAIELAERFDIDVILLARGVSIADHADLPPLLRLCTGRDIALVAASPFVGGRLANPEYADFMQKITALCTRHGVQFEAVAVQFPLAMPQVMTVLWSTKTPARVAATAKAMASPIPAELWSDCRDMGLIAPYAFDLIARKDNHHEQA